MSDVDLEEFLVGGWTLLGWRIEYADGRISWPFGDGAQGQILYTADGCMSATISAANRSALSEQNVRNVPLAEQAEAFASYFHYAGRWRIDGANVVHQVELGLNPGFPGSLQIRRVEIIDTSRMILSAEEPLSDGTQRRHAIEWQRVEANS